LVQQLLLSGWDDNFHDYRFANVFFANIYDLSKLSVIDFFNFSSRGFWLDMTYAKSGWRTSAVPLFCMVTMYFLWKAMNTNKTQNILFLPEFSWL